MSIYEACFVTYPQQRFVAWLMQTLLSLPLTLLFTNLPFWHYGPDAFSSLLFFSYPIQLTSRLLSLFWMANYLSLAVVQQVTAKNLCYYYNYTILGNCISYSIVVLCISSFTYFSSSCLTNNLKVNQLIKKQSKKCDFVALW